MYASVIRGMGMGYGQGNNDATGIMVCSTAAADGGTTEGVTREENATTSLKFHPETIASSKSHKTSPVWAYFSNFDLLYHPEMKSFRICLICRSKGIDKAKSVGKDYTPWPLVTHL